MSLSAAAFFAATSAALVGSDFVDRAAPKGAKIRQIAITDAVMAGFLVLQLIVFWIPLAFVPDSIQYQNENSIYLKEISFLFLCPIALTLGLGAISFDRERKVLRKCPKILIPVLALATWIVLLLIFAPYQEAALSAAHKWFCALSLALAASILLQRKHLLLNPFLLPPIFN